MNDRALVSRLLLVIVFKLVVLAGIWLVCFRADLGAPGAGANLVSGHQNNNGENLNADRTLG